MSGSVWEELIVNDAKRIKELKKQGVLEELVKQVKDLEIIKKLLTNDIDCVGNLNIVKNRNKLWFLTGEINIVGNQIERVNNRIKDLENKKEEGCKKQ